MRMSRPGVLLGIVLAAGAAPASAAVLALAPVANANDLHIIDVATSNATLLEASSCCAVQAGAVAADTVDHRVLFLANDSSGAQLYRFGYGVGATLTSVPISPGVRVTHLAYDAAHARLVGFAAVGGGGVDVVTLDPGSGTVTVTGAPANCCVLRAGVVAYFGGAGVLYGVGRRSGDTTDQLLAFSVDDGALQDAYDLGDEIVSQLVADGASLYALSYAQSTGLLRPALLTFAPAFALTPIGGGTSDCCFVLAGPAAIDHAAGALVASTRPLGATGANFAIRAFSLSDGSVSTGNAVPAIGLFEDGAVLFDRIYADSFE